MLIRYIKIVFFYILKILGVLRLGRYLNRHALIILCYHGVSIHDEHRFLPALFVSPKTFARRMHHLSNDYVVLPLEKALLKGGFSGNDGQYRVVITFDDGFFNFASQAVPILDQYRFPATVYLTTYYVEHQLPIPNLMADYVFKRIGGASKTLKPGDGLTGSSDNVTALEAFLKKIGKMHAQEKDLALRRLLEAVDISYEELAYDRSFNLMNTTEVRRLSLRGFDFQLHTHRHRNVIDNREALEGEIEENKRKIVELTGKIPQHFAFPSGRWDVDALPRLSQCGVISAVTMDQGLNYAEADHLCLRRIFDSENNHQMEFEWKLSGIKEILYSMLGRLRR